MARQAVKKQILIDWLLNPNTPKDAWHTMSYKEIAEATKLSTPYVGSILIRTVVETLKLDYQYVKEMRETGRAGNEGTTTSNEKIEQINTLLREGKTPDEVAHITSVSRSTVDRHNKERKKRSKNNTKPEE